ncbi:MAG: saccharopine dehydrogenase NADP-binding domain-containing protein [Sphingopyxis sp.]|nr:saccharopine dehydrogenase NADP-binding domain-containing protein [Sphingopyxis sp.]
MTSIYQVVVLGANGHTGRFVVDALRRQEVIAIPATRTGRFTPIDGVEEDGRVLDFSRREALDRTLAGANAVINCAGPFFDTAIPGAEAALRAGIPYLDIAAEQRTALNLFEILDEKAKKAGVTILPAMAFYGGLADLLVSALTPDGSAVDSIEIAMGLDSWHPTAGTRLTSEKNVYPRMIVRDGALAPIPDPAPAKRWTFPEPLGEQPVTCVALSEIILISRHIRAKAITSFMNLKPLDDLHHSTTPPPQAIDARGRSAQKFALEACVTAQGQTRHATATGIDIYATSAPLIVKACLALLDGTHEAGVRAPGELFEAKAFLAGLSSEIAVEYRHSRPCHPG